MIDSIRATYYYFILRQLKKEDDVCHPSILDFPYKTCVTNHASIGHGNKWIAGKGNRLGWHFCTFSILPVAANNRMCLPGRFCRVNGKNEKIINNNWQNSKPPTMCGLVRPSSAAVSSIRCNPNRNSTQNIHWILWRCGKKCVCGQPQSDTTTRWQALTLIKDKRIKNGFMFGSHITIDKVVASAREVFIPTDEKKNVLYFYDFYFGRPFLVQVASGLDLPTRNILPQSESAYNIFALLCVPCVTFVAPKPSRVEVKVITDINFWTMRGDKFGCFLQQCAPMYV